MRTATGLLAVCLASTTVLADPTPHPPPPGQRAPGPTATGGTLSDTRLLDPIRVDSLTLTPIASTRPAASDGGDLIVLDEATAKKLVHIAETGEVNELTLTNDASKPLFLLAGEVVLGGRQDRIIGRNTIIPAKTTQAVPVYCVEHGRWTGDSSEFKSSGALAHGKLRGKASFESQSDVWDEVHDKNAKRKTTNDTDTYRQVAQQETAGAIAKLDAQVTTALGKLPAADRGRLVGFAVAINGQIQTVDVFQSHALFAKLQDKLVRSYLADAIDVPADAHAKTPTAADIQTFVADAAKAEAEQSYDTKAAHTYVQKGDHADAAKVTLEPRAGAPAVYETVEAK